MINERKIKSPEYATSAERMGALWEMAVDGQEAEAVIKYANIFLNECEQNVLTRIREGKDTNEAILEYRVAFQFMEMLKHVAIVGKQKKAVYEDMKRAKH